MVRCGVYLRISRENREAVESDSITNQRKIIDAYIDRHSDLRRWCEWVDDGVSGIHFERPGIQAMLQAIEGKEIDCVIVKDLSRFGRDYIETGYYLQYLFPQRGIRFIAVCDQYDSAKSDFVERNLFVPILNILNDSYCQDISRKVRLGQDSKRKEGAYIGAFCVYGYIKNPMNHNILCIDQCVAAIIVKIFTWRIQGHSAEKISSFLNYLEIPSPMEYKRQRLERFVTSFQKARHSRWSPTAVRRILQNEMYTGVMQQGKSKKISYKLSIRENISKKDWITIPMQSLQIVPKKIFLQAQKPLKRGRGAHKSDCNLCEGIGTTSE